MVLNYPMSYFDANQSRKDRPYAKYDLTKLNQDFIDRLRSRVIQAGEAGVYTSGMLFEAGVG